jgi:hypothetical protein
MAGTEQESLPRVSVYFLLAEEANAVLHVDVALDSQRASLSEQQNGPLQNHLAHGGQVRMITAAHVPDRLEAHLRKMSVIRSLVTTGKMVEGAQGVPDELSKEAAATLLGREAGLSHTHSVDIHEQALLLAGSSIGPENASYRPFFIQAYEAAAH